MRATFNGFAERELNDGAHYYEHEQPGLGSAFITDMQRCTEELLAFPPRRFNCPRSHPAPVVPAARARFACTHREPLAAHTSKPS